MAPRKKSAAISNPFEIKLNEAEDLQQRAERRRGNDAITCYESSVAAYQQALQLATTSSPSFDRICDCKFGLAESLENLAQNLLQITASAPDEQLTKEREQEALSRACALFSQSFDNYRMVFDNPAAAAAAQTNSNQSSLNPTADTMRVDAAVNAGNALSSWVEALTDANPEIAPSARSQASAMLKQAEECYSAALKKEEDASTLSNLGDLLIQHGELLCSGGAGEQGGEYFHRAREAYAQACGLCSSENGDDLPGLLLNWGSGVLAAAGHAQVAEAALPLLDEAIIRLRESIGFDRGDALPHNALGEALVAKSEWLMKSGDQHGAAVALQSALEDGYGGALRILSGHSDALVGVAEARAQQAKLATAMGDGAAAATLYQAAAEAYEKALANPQNLGNMSQRSDVRYNYACCLAGCGRVNEAADVVQQLIATGSVSAADVAQDADLVALKDMFH